MKDQFSPSEYRRQLTRDFFVLVACGVTSVFLLALYFAVQYGSQIDNVCNKFLK